MDAYRHMEAPVSSGACRTLEPIAPYPSEIASAYICMAGSDPADPATHNQPIPVAPNLGRRDLRGMTIGYMPAWFEHADSEIAPHCRSMLHYYRSAGAELREISVPGRSSAGRPYDNHH
jgi:Asp-tRNA(Asn)/Glu-tRNA(Gln) amidotransferase A subunit family amidase